MPSISPNSLAIIGAGPVGLEAALAALDRGLDAHVYEQGEVASHALAWGHVRMFTPWRMNVGPHSRAHLEAAGWRAPDLEARPTGRELAERYLQPLAALPELKDRVHAFAQVVRAGRRGFRRHEEHGTGARRGQPLRLLVRDPGGRESLVHAFALLDASGVYDHPDWAGSGGIPAPNEAFLRPRMACHLEDVLDVHRDRYAGRRALVIGEGTSAALAVADLASLAGEAPGTSVVWVTRAAAGALYPEAESDRLTPRRDLFLRARALAAGALNSIVHVGGAEVEGFDLDPRTHRHRVTLAIGGESRIEEADRVVVHAGFSADDALGRELQPDEPRFFVVGHKSFDRNEEFLLETGYRQADDVVERLAAEPEPA